MSEETNAAMENVLASASSISDRRQKIEQYKLILASVLASLPTDISHAKRLIDHFSDICASPSTQQPFAAAAACFYPGKLWLRLPDSIDLRLVLKNMAQNSISTALKFEFGREDKTQAFCSAFEQCKHGKISETSMGSPC